MDSIPPALAASLSGRYRLERELGHGGMAVVYLAQDLKHERQVALKVIKPDLAGLIGRSRFSREIKVAARLQHPHICSVYDSGATEDDQLWYTMPYVAGESLRDRLRREQRLPVADAVRITREAAQALEYAHKQGVIHRDIKPENILLTEDGTTLVADFGIAKGDTGSDVAKPGTQLTETGFAVGTPAYMSPEQRLGVPVDARSDVYSLAATLYELLLGELPPSGGAGLDLFFANMTGAQPKLKLKRPEISDALDALVQQGIAPDPAKRFQTMGEMRQALDAISTGRSGVTPAPGNSMKLLGRLGIAAALIALLGFGARYAWTRWSTPTRRVVAIVPFNTAPGDSTLKDIAWSFAEDLRRSLRHVPGWSTATEAATQRVTGGRIATREIARQLGAEIVVKGEMVRVGDGYTLTFDVSRPGKTNEAKRAVLSGSLKQLVDLRDSMTTLALSLAGERPDRDDVLASGRFRIATDVPESYALYGQVTRQMFTPGANNHNRATGDLILARDDSVLARDPRFLDVLSDRGWNALVYRREMVGQLSKEEAEGKMRDATEMLARARAVDPTHPWTERLAGAVMLAGGDTTGALEVLRGAAAAEPVFLILFDLCTLEAAVQRPPAPTPRSCRQMAESDSLNPLALATVAFVLDRYGRTEETLPYLRAAARLAPTMPAYRLEVGRTLRNLNRFDEAVAEIRAAAAAAPDDPYTHQLLGFSLAEVEQPAEAVREARLMLEKSPGDVFRLEYASRIEASVGETDSAVATARKIVAALPKAPVGYGILAQRLWDNRQFDAALDAFATAAKLEDQNPARYFTWNNYLRLAGRIGEAQSVLDRGLALAGTAPAGRTAMAKHLLWIGKFDEALAALAPLAADTTSADVWVNLSYYQNAGGHPEMGLSSSERAIKLDSTNSSAYSNLAMARYLRGDRAGAIQASDLLRRYDSWDQASIAQQIWFYFRGGQPAAARAKLDSLERRAARFRPSLIPLIIGYIGVGDTTKARTLLAESAVRREAKWLSFLPSDPLFADLRGTPEYKEMMRLFLQSGDRAN